MKGKIAAEEKARLVRGYLDGAISMWDVKQEYGVHHTTFHEWVRRYEARGSSGFVETAKRRRYEPALKRCAVEDYLSGDGSLSAICKKYDISDRKMLRLWILWYNGHGDFKQPNSEGRICMQKGRKTTLEERVDMVSHCITNNRDYGKTIEAYGVSYQQIYAWVQKYEKYGADGLIDRRGKRREEASMSEVEKLRAQLKLQQAENVRLQMENDLLKKLDEVERGRGRN